MTGLNALAGLLALAAFAPPDGPPPAAVALLSALESGDVSAARATLADDATIADSSSGTGAESTLASLSEHARGCTRSDLSWEYDSAQPQNASVSLIWNCPSRAPSQTFVWTAGARVVWVQFGLSAPETSQ